MTKNILELLKVESMPIQLQHQVFVPLMVDDGVERIRVSFDGFAHNSKGQDRWVQQKGWLWFDMKELMTFSRPEGDK